MHFLKAEFFKSFYVSAVAMFSYLIFLNLYFQPVFWGMLRKRCILLLRPNRTGSPMLLQCKKTLPNTRAQNLDVSLWPVLDDFRYVNTYNFV